MLMTSKRIAIVTALLATGLSALPVARASDKGSREREAKRACLNGEVDVGVKLLTDLYVDSNDPTYIFNQGRCFEQNARYEDAIRRFREYLRKVRKASAEEKADVEKHVADCQALMQKEGQKEGEKLDQDAATATPALASPSLPAAPIMQPTAGAVVQLDGNSRSGGGSGLRIGGVIALSAGAAALVTGIALNLKYNSMTRDLKSYYDKGSASTSLSYKDWSQVCYVAGAALAVGGGLMYYLGWRAGRVTVAPMTTAGTFGLAVLGAL
jgi:hypothetical protein